MRRFPDKTVEELEAMVLDRDQRLADLAQASGFAREIRDRQHELWRQARAVYQAAQRAGLVDRFAPEPAQLGLPGVMTRLLSICNSIRPFLDLVPSAYLEGRVDGRSWADSHTKQRVEDLICQLETRYPTDSKPLGAISNPEPLPRRNQSWSGSAP